jgi:acyl carrier protein
MSNVDLSPAAREELLVRCFSSVFPALTLDEIHTVSSDTPGVWDSLATVTLIAVIEEEFGIQIEQARMRDLNSFAAFLASTEKETSPGA